jgi:phage terminase large subunit-like protein
MILLDILFPNTVKGEKLKEKAKMVLEELKKNGKTELSNIKKLCGSKANYKQIIDKFQKIKLIKIKREGGNKSIKFFVELSVNECLNFFNEEIQNDIISFFKS